MKLGGARLEGPVPQEVAAWAREVRRVAERDAGAWRRQRETIDARIEARPSRRGAWGAALAVATACGLVVGVLLGRGPVLPAAPTAGPAAAVSRPAADGTALATLQGDRDQDDELMLEVERATARQVPLALELVDVPTD